ncbi:putative oxidoreductase [Granulicella sibirica]|uniref:Putative oxidoreductase n=1 Tax=Granulicella sibirica TaxID=2479048 RepID=A0A4V1L4Y3_9BACT|nr:putative oxidoreductase [Granulicella sibirica]
MVLANGQQVSVDATHEPDLFWALRGGGNGFGVVTSARLATYSCPHVPSTQNNFPLSSGRRPLMIIQDLLDEEPDRLGLTPVFAKVDDGPAILSLQFAWIGLEEEGRAVLKVLSDLPGAQVANVGLVPFRETLDRGELWPWGKVWGARTRSLSRLDGAVVDTCLEVAETMPSLGARLFLHDFHGYASRVPLSETAFALREDHYVAAALVACQSLVTRMARRSCASGWTTWPAVSKNRPCRVGTSISLLLQTRNGSNASTAKLRRDFGRSSCKLIPTIGSAALRLDCGRESLERVSIALRDAG